MADEQRRTAGAVVVALAALLLASPTPSAAWASLAVAGSSADPTGPLVAAVALLAWAVAGWLALTVAVLLLSRVPGLMGRTARALAARVAPATVRRTVEAALGLTVAVGALAPATALAAPVAGPSAAVVLGAEAAWDLDWPSSSGAPAPEVVRPRAPTATTRPTAPISAPSTRPPWVTPPSAPPPSDPTPTVRPGASAPTSVPPAIVRPSPVLPGAGALVVRAGDNLWSLAEASLRSAGTASPTDQQVAQAWPRWWAANREAIGDDPDLLQPGTVLRPPADSPGTS